MSSDSIASSTTISGPSVTQEIIAKIAAAENSTNTESNNDSNETTDLDLDPVTAAELKEAVSNQPSTSPNTATAKPDDAKAEPVELSKEDQAKLKASQSELERILSDPVRTNTAIAEFRSKLQNEIAAAAAQNQELALDTQRFDRTVIRWLTARKFDINKSIDMWKNAIKWRTENKIDTVLNDPYPDGQLVFKLLANHCDHKFDKMGRTVYIESIGLLEPKNIISKDPRLGEKIAYYQFQSTEWRRKVLMAMGSITAGQYRDQIVSIVDLKGLGMKHCKKDVYNFVKKLSEVSQAYYPEFLGKLFIINAPTLFSVVWKIVRPYLDIRTQTKIEIHKDSGIKSLLQVIDADSLPKSLGGNCQCEGGDCMQNARSQYEWRKLCELGWEKWSKQSDLHTAIADIAIGCKTTEERDKKLKEYQNLYRDEIMKPATNTGPNGTIAQPPPAKKK